MSEWGLAESYREEGGLFVEHEDEGILMVHGNFRIMVHDE